ncbi:hypothetical protein [Petropleomorpha daqingensis]|uniref:DUF892 family protein n=1 Tax=Petropleomorpha daqingensis TaxID=2026353 RepID=A0A853CBZ2_9ACTN|nr:hypothetical protein [Petropleomorpha daqingensis]
MKLDMAIEELHRSENELYAVLLSMSDRHTTDHEVFHVTRDMATWCRQHVARLAGTGREFGLELDAEARQTTGLLEKLQQKTSELTGRMSALGLLLLADLRHLYREAGGTALDWELLAQGAQGAKNEQLLDLAERCHPQTLRISKWAEAKLKETSPQVLAG